MNIVGYEIDLDVFRAYAGQALPRHVAYPMPTWWEDYDAAAAAALLGESAAAAPSRDLSLYLHVPFCERLCRYCACTRVALPRKAAGAAEKTGGYLHALEREVAQLASQLGAKRRVRQIHWGGGTPTYLSAAELTGLHEMLLQHFELADDAEIAIELDPRVTTDDMLETLRGLGFNRASLGVQDFDPQVQKHVGRVQPFEQVRDLVQRCRDLGFVSVNFDLIYGLPRQTPATIADTIAKTIAIGPDRIAYYQFAQIPDKVAVQRGLDYDRLPDSETKLEMFLLGLRDFTAGGYEFIGLDHFARPDEPLAQAYRDGTLQRNFQGMTTGGGLDLVGLGPSSISHLAGLGFLQNVRDVADYAARIESGQTPIFRGKRFTRDDVIRQAALAQLYCTGAIEPQKIAAEFDIDFADYFAREIGVMNELAGDGLVTVANNGRIEATLPLGRVLIRTVAAVFDAYLEPDAYRRGDRQYFSTNA